MQKKKKSLFIKLISIKKMIQLDLNQVNFTISRFQIIIWQNIFTL